MKAVELIRERIPVADGDFYSIKIWQLQQPVHGSKHRFKYSLSYIVDGECVLRYDNESGKGDHQHWDEVESPYRFVDIAKLIDDFRKDIRRWDDENRDL